MLVAVRLAVLAHEALALFSALHSCAVALAVIFAAAGLLAGALAFWHEGRYSLEGAGVPEVRQLLRLVDLQPALGFVAAGVAVAALSADPPLREALAVHFQAVDFGALTSRLALPRREVELGNRPQHLCPLSRPLLFLDQQVEQIPGICQVESILLDLLISYEFHGARGRGGAARLYS